MKMMPEAAESDSMDELYSGSHGEKKTPKTVDEQEKEELGDTAIVPVKILTGGSDKPLETGDEVVLKVKEINGDQAVVYYSKTPPSEIGKEGPPTGDEMSADDELDNMGKENY
jgi:hypothetical protein